LNARQTWLLRINACFGFQKTNICYYQIIENLILENRRRESTFSRPEIGDAIRKRWRVRPVRVHYCPIKTGSQATERFFEALKTIHKTRLRQIHKTTDTQTTENITIIIVLFLCAFYGTLLQNDDDGRGGARGT